MTAGQGIPTSGLQQNEKELEAVLESLRFYPEGQIIAPGGDLSHRLEWLLDVWDVALDRKSVV